jgi:hypothetical protein
MSRRIVPVTCWVTTVIVVLVLLLPEVIKASGLSNRLSNLEGIWDGFFLTANGVTGLVNSDITEQDGRRIEGEGALFDLGGADDVEYRFKGTLARRNSLVNGTGNSSIGRLNFQADLETYASEPPEFPFQTSQEPGVGDAGVMYPEFRFVQSRGRPRQVSALLLHPFAGEAPPDLSGNFVGPFVNVGDPTTGDPPDPNFQGIGLMQISPLTDRGIFAGRVDLFLDPEGPPLLSWPFYATASDHHRVIWTAQGAAGQIVYDGVVVPDPDPESDGFQLDGIFRLLFNDGRLLFNAYNCRAISISR